MVICGQQATVALKRAQHSLKADVFFTTGTQIGSIRLGFH